MAWGQCTNEETDFRSGDQKRREKVERRLIV